MKNSALGRPLWDRGENFWREPPGEVVHQGDQFWEVERGGLSCHREEEDGAITDGETGWEGWYGWGYVGPLPKVGESTGNSLCGMIAGASGNVWVCKDRPLGGAV